MKAWHYEHKGQRLGPVAHTEMVALIEQGTIGADTLVWSQGQTDWGKLQGSVLGADLARHLGSRSTPPPLPGSRVPNGVVWVLAGAAVLGLLLESILAGALAPSESMAEEAMLVAIASGTYWYVSLALNLGLSYLDDWRLRRAGVDTSAFGKVAFLVPVYLWKRAKALGQRPLYFWTWIAGFVFVMLSAVGAAGLQEELQGGMGSAETAPLVAAEGTGSKEAASTALSQPTGSVHANLERGGVSERSHGIAGGSGPSARGQRDVGTLCGAAEVQHC